jgi:uncharacterized protein YerC
MGTQSEGTGRLVDTLHNQDKVLKESFALYKGRSLDFLDSHLAGEITEILNTEMTETTTKKAYADNALKLSTGKGIHRDWEADISEDDMMRIGSYHIDLSRMHKIPFTTVIITAKAPRTTQYASPSMTFAPKIINLKDRDADKALAEIDRKLKAEKHHEINELEIIYLPLYSSASGKTTADLLDLAIKLTPQIVKNDKKKQEKLQDLLILLTGSFISESELNKVMEANMRILEDTTGFRLIEARGRNQRDIEIAQNMLRRGRNYQEISEDTGLSIEKIDELAKELFV